MGRMKQGNNEGSEFVVNGDLVDNVISSNQGLNRANSPEKYKATQRKRLSEI